MQVARLDSLKILLSYHDLFTSKSTETWLKIHSLWAKLKKAGDTCFCDVTQMSVSYDIDLQLWLEQTFMSEQQQQAGQKHGVHVVAYTHMGDIREVVWRHFMFVFLLFEEMVTIDCVGFGCKYVYLWNTWNIVVNK